MRQNIENYDMTSDTDLETEVRTMNHCNEEEQTREELMEQINKDFGSYDKFKNQFNEAARVVEASGWCLLVWVPSFKKLEILQCEKHQNLTLWGCIPLLVLDMWEHSYFLQYKADRKEYINAIWNIVNWNIVNKRYSMKNNEIIR